MPRMCSITFNKMYMSSYFNFLFYALLLVTLAFPLVTSVVTWLCLVCFIFLIGVFVLFYLGLEFVPLLLLNVSLGAIIILFGISFLITRNKFTIDALCVQKPVFYLFYLFTSIKCFLFFHNFEYSLCTNISVYNQIFELDSLFLLYEFPFIEGYSLILLILGFLLLIIAIIISSIFFTIKL